MKVGRDTDRAHEKATEGSIVNGELFWQHAFSSFWFWKRVGSRMFLGRLRVGQSWLCRRWEAEAARLEFICLVFHSVAREGSGNVRVLYS